MQLEPHIYIVDNDQAMLDSLSWLIESVNLKVKPYLCPKKFLAEYDNDLHSCALLEVRLPGLSGVDVQKQLIKQSCDLPIIFLSGYVDIALTVETIKAGAVDFLIKPFNDRQLIDSIYQALHLDKKLRLQKKEIVNYQNKIALLSQREMQVLDGIIAGEQNKLISQKLNISLKTVEAHRASMMKKMNVTSVVELIKLVMNKPLISP